MTFWEMFYNLCIENGTRPNTVAKELGFSSAVCTQWKKGQQKPSVEKIAKIAEYFNVSTDYLLGKETVRHATDDELKFALFNGSEGVTDEMFNEVKQFAEMVKMRENAKRKETK